MSKAQIISYAAAVIIITLLVYLYTSDVHAPENINNDNYIHAEAESNSESVPGDNNENSYPINTEYVPPSQTESTEATTNNFLANTTWRWLRTESATGTIVSEPRTTVPFILEFTSSGSITSQTDCNTIGGTYTQMDTTLSFGPLMSTKMYCERSKEADYAQNLSEVESFIIIDNTLRLFLSENSEVMFFVRVKD